MDNVIDINKLDKLAYLSIKRGVALKKDQTDFIKKLLQKRLLTVKASENVVRLLPPLNVTKKEINLALKILNNVCENYK